MHAQDTFFFLSLQILRANVIFLQQRPNSLSDTLTLQIEKLFCSNFSIVTMEVLLFLKEFLQSHLKGFIFSTMRVQDIYSWRQNISWSEGRHFEVFVVSPHLRARCAPGREGVSGGVEYCLSSPTSCDNEQHSLTLSGAGAHCETLPIFIPHQRRHKSAHSTMISSHVFSSD